MKNLTQPTPKNHDNDIKRIIVSAIVCITYYFAVAVVLLCLTERPVPDALDRLMNISLGALIGFLAKTTVDALGRPVDTRIVNEGDAEAVPVKDLDIQEK